ncbi:hypothetical protein ACFVQ0_14530 [Streptomyces sp. NPDC057900]|uniref:hypothetical protein n=1 Tax=Streptomyces sp. NPDC057900 TaxID=3346274 RepID=UPI0036EA65FD
MTGRRGPGDRQPPAEHDGRSSWSPVAVAALAGMRGKRLRAFYAVALFMADAAVVAAVWT